MTKSTQHSSNFGANYGHIARFDASGLARLRETPQINLNRWLDDAYPSHETTHESISLGLPRNRMSGSQMIHEFSAAFGGSGQSRHAAITTQDWDKGAVQEQVQDQHDNADEVNVAGHTNSPELSNYLREIEVFDTQTLRAAILTQDTERKAVHEMNSATKRQDKSDEKDVLEETKAAELSDYVPKEGGDTVQVLYARNPVPGENPPYELATGRLTTAPRRTRQAEMTRVEEPVVTGSTLSSSSNEGRSGPARVRTTSSSNGSRQRNLQTPATGRRPLSRRIQRSPSGQRPRTQGARKQQRSAQYVTSNSSTVESMLVEQSDMSREPSQHVIPFYQQLSRSRNDSQLLRPDTALANHPSYHDPGLQQAFTSPFGTLVHVANYHQRHLQLPEDVWQSNHEVHASPTENSENISQNFFQQGQLSLNSDLFSWDYSSLETFDTMTRDTDSYPNQPTGNFHGSLPSLSASSMTPPSEQSLVAPNNYQPRDSRPMHASPPTWTATSAVSKPGRKGDQVEPWDRFEDFVDFGSLG